MKKKTEIENDGYGYGPCHKYILTHKDHRIDACASRHIIKKKIFGGNFI